MPTSRTQLLPLLALAAPTAALGWSTEDFCGPLMQMVEQAPSAFESLRGPATEIPGLVQDFTYVSTLELPGAVQCTIGMFGGVSQDRSLTCTYKRGGAKPTEKGFLKLEEAVRACVPEEWSVHRGRGETADAETVLAQAPGGMNATSVQVTRRQADAKKFTLEVRVVGY